MTKHQACTLLVCFVLVSGCTRETATPLPIPEQLVHLPAKATTIGCPGELRPPGIVNAFELPGLTPEDDSAGSSDRGRDLFILPYCEKIDVFDYAWSEMDQRYYLHIRLRDGREGWTWESVVTLE
jgi:hypothetical protein